MLAQLEVLVAGCQMQSTAIRVEVHDVVGRLVFVLVVLHFHVLISACLSLAHACGVV